MEFFEFYICILQKLNFNIFTKIKKKYSELFSLNSFEFCILKKYILIKNKILQISRFADFR
jgi:hypothetical protein